jgi:ABC-type antimicrobial peptide transport system permease subunit
MRDIPGVQNAAVGLTLPYERALIDGVALAGGKAGEEISTDEVYVAPGFFSTLQIPVLAGRTFTDRDNSDALKVVVINRTFALKFFHNLNPIGRYLKRDNKNSLIIGVVADTVGSSASGLTDDPAPLTSEQTIYLPAAQIDDEFNLSLVHAWFQPSWIVRAGRVEGLTAQMQRALGSADPNLPISGFYDMRDLMIRTLAIQRIEVALLGSLSLLALLLSAVGIFALVANTVVQRTREIGIRMALGSTIGQAMIRVGRPGVSASLAGVFLGLAVAAEALRVMRNVIYGVGIYDALTLGIVVLTLVSATILATALPILKIAKIDPAKTLREE